MIYARDNFAKDNGVFQIVNVGDDATFTYQNGSLVCDKLSGTSQWDATGLQELVPRDLEIGDRYVFELEVLESVEPVNFKIGLQLDKTTGQGLEREYYGCYVEAGIPKYDNGGGTSIGLDAIVLGDKYRFICDVQADSSLAVWFPGKGQNPNTAYLGNPATPLINRDARLCFNLYSKSKVRLIDYKASDLSGV